MHALTKKKKYEKSSLTLLSRFAAVGTTRSSSSMRSRRVRQSSIASSKWPFKSRMLSLHCAIAAAASSDRAAAASAL